MIEHDEKAGVDSDVTISDDPNWSSSASDWLHVRAKYCSKTPTNCPVVSILDEATAFSQFT
jgi:hypothetical protein